MRVDERDREDASGSVVFPVAPVRPRHAVPRTLMVALVVGGLAFFAGIQVGAWGTADRARPSITRSTPPPLASAIAAVPPVLAAPGTSVTPSQVPAPPGSSIFVRDFKPADIVAGLPGGTGCVTSPAQLEVPRTRRDGPRMTFVRSWMTYCPLPEERRQSFLLGVIDALVLQVPNETYGFSTAARGSGGALFPYADGPYAGTVTLSADAAGSGFVIAVVLQHRLAQ